MTKFEILAARAKTGKSAHVRTIVEAATAPAALRAYGVRNPGKARSIVTKRGWRLSARKAA